MRATGVNHVSISAPDLEASVRFYVEVLGMKRVPAPRFGGQPVAWLRVGDQQLHLFQREGAPQYHHFGIDVDDFEAALDALPITPSTYVVLVTRGHTHDVHSLRRIVERPAAYIGMIGSRRRAFVGAAPPTKRWPGSN